MIRSKKTPKLKNSAIVLDDMGYKLIKDIVYYYTEERHHSVQMIVRCHKAAQMIITSSDTIYLTTYNGPDLFKKFNEMYRCERKFFEKIDDLNSNHFNCTDGMSDKLRWGMIKDNKKEKTFFNFDRNRSMI